MGDSRGLPPREIRDGRMTLLRCLPILLAALIYPAVGQGGMLIGRAVTVAAAVRILVGQVA